MSGSKAVFVEAPARLHMGLLDLRGDLGRQFGGLGAALEAPSLLIEARAAAQLSAEGEDAERLLGHARRYLEHNAIAGGAALRVHRAIPAHAGLGSGTQLALAAARALAALYDRPTDALALAAATSRARRSAIGTWAFQHGGFVLEGGRRVASGGVAPLLLQRPMPADWRAVVVIPDVPHSFSGAQEEEAFRRLPPPSPELLGQIARLVMMVVLPALVEEDLPAFGKGVTDVQRLVGEMFRPVEGDRLAVTRLVEELLDAGAAGAGQSSWGPAVYGLFQGDAAARRVAERFSVRLAGRGSAFATAFNNSGARCWTA